MIIYFKKKYFILFTCFVLVIITCPRSSIGYGYKRNEDPIITVFKSVIFYGRKDDWARVEADINTINDRVDDIRNLFDVDLKSRLDASISQHKFQAVIKAMATSASGHHLGRALTNQKRVHQMFLTKQK